VVFNFIVRKIGFKSFVVSAKMVNSTAFIDMENEKKKDKENIKNKKAFL